MKIWIIIKTQSNNGTQNHDRPKAGKEKTMKYYRRKERAANTYYSKYQPCWTCKNCYDGCSWSREFKPVDGWKAIKTYIQDNDNYADSYKIIYCPEYIED